MALGYCEACQTLRSIVKVGLKALSREAEWAPVDHEDPAGERCPGSRRPIRDHREALPDLATLKKR